jgi:transcriptional regulator with XRE-family HTH domain
MAPNRWVRPEGTLQDGRILRQIRIRRKLTIPQGAALIGCHPKALSNLEREQRGASEVMLQKLADAYGVKPEEIRKQDNQGADAA